MDEDGYITYTNKETGEKTRVKNIEVIEFNVEPPSPTYEITKIEFYPEPPPNENVLSYTPSIKPGGSVAIYVKTDNVAHGTILYMTINSDDGLTSANFDTRPQPTIGTDGVLYDKYPFEIIIRKTYPAPSTLASGFTSIDANEDVEGLPKKFKIDIRKDSYEGDIVLTSREITIEPAE